MVKNVKKYNDDSFRPIGFFDSGVGGISVLRQAIQILPGEDFIYYGDNKNVPYGNKSEEEIRHLAINCGSFLYNKGVKAMVVACNTATSIAVREMRDRFHIPVISIEPAVKPALESGLCGKILVLATPATLAQSRYINLLNRLGSRERIINIPCEGLAELIECGNLNNMDIVSYIERKLIPYCNISIAGIVLGCTHYSFIEPQISSIARSLFKTKFKIYDGKYGVARRLKFILEENNLLNPKKRNNNVEFYASGDQHEINVFKKFLFEDINNL